LPVYIGEKASIKNGIELIAEGPRKWMLCTVLIGHLPSPIAENRETVSHQISNKSDSPLAAPAV
jgi:hypothetical protein